MGSYSYRCVHKGVRIEKWWYALGILFFNTVLSIPPSVVRGIGQELLEFIPNIFKCAISLLL